MRSSGIRGLTDGDASFPMIGKLRKGTPKQRNARGEEIYGKDLDYFRFDSKDQRAIAAFEGAYGQEPREIHVSFPHATTEENFITCKEEWGAGGLVHRCDGEVCSAIRIGSVIQRHFVSNPPCPYFAGKERTKKEPGCKEIGRLQVIIPALKRFAYVTAETHSLNDIVNLHQQLKAVEMAFGRLNALPFLLCRRPVDVSTPTPTGRARREKWLLSIEISPEWAERQLAASHQAAMERSKVYLAIAPRPYALPHADRDANWELEEQKELLMERIDSDVARVGWTREREAEHLLRTYKKATREQLTDSELLDFADAMTYQAVSLWNSDPAPLNYQEIDEVPHVPEISESELRRQELMEAIASEMRSRLRWSKRKASDFLMEKYGKPTRNDLTDAELMECAGHLMNLQPIVLEDDLTDAMTYQDDEGDRA